MELEKLIIANEVRNKFEIYSESLQHIDELVERINKGAKYNLSLTTNDGWGRQMIDIPIDAIQEALPIIRESLVRNIDKLNQQFKEL